jgi:hypothetical protein
MRPAALVRAVLPDARSLGFVCLFVCSFGVFVCGGPVRNGRARAGTSPARSEGPLGVLVHAQALTRTHAHTGRHTRTHARTHAPAYAHPYTLIQAHAQGASVERPADVSGGCLPYKERSVGRNDGTVPECPFTFSVRACIVLQGWRRHCSAAPQRMPTSFPSRCMNCIADIPRYHESRF